MRKIIALVFLLTASSVHAKFKTDLLTVDTITFTRDGSQMIIAPGAGGSGGGSSIYPATGTILSASTGIKISSIPASSSAYELLYSTIQYFGPTQKNYIHNDIIIPDGGEGSLDGFQIDLATAPQPVMPLSYFYMRARTMGFISGTANTGFTMDGANNTMSFNGDATFNDSVSASTYYGDGSNLTGISAGGGGYAVEHATVTFNLDQGFSASTGTVSGQLNVNGDIVRSSIAGIDNVTRISNGNSDTNPFLSSTENTGTYGWGFFDRGTEGNFQLNEKIGGAWTNVMTVDRSNGNVGIGTTAPGAKLNILDNTGESNGIKFETIGWPYKNRIGQNGTGGDDFIISQNYSFANSAVDHAYYTNAITLNNASNPGINFMTGNINSAPTSRMFINYLGNVGIGTTNPTTKLDVNGPSGITSFTGTTPLGVLVRGALSSNDYSGIDFTTYGGFLPYARIGAVVYGSGTALRFGTSDGYTSGITNTAMTIDNLGNVGIGTTAPGAKLNILDNTGESNGIKFETIGWPYKNRIGQNGTGGDDFIISQNYSFANSAVDHAYYTNAITLNNASNPGINFMTGNINSAPTSRMFINYLGNVGIGTTTPSYLLDVTGVVRSTGSIVGTGVRILYYCSAGVSAGTTCYGSTGCTCVGGSWVDTGYKGN